MKDVLGLALSDYYHHSDPDTLWVQFKFSSKEAMPVELYFRSMEEMPELEWVAIQQCRGKILDIGAGAGSHSLALQRMGQDITALDISPLSAAVMKERSIQKIIRQDFFELDAGQYDTLLLMMNGIGICGTLDGLRQFFTKARQLLAPGGQLVFDSSDIAYLFKDQSVETEDYYGEILYQYEYKKEKSGWLKWVFIDRKTLKTIATEEGWDMELIFDDGKDQYLARCRPQQK